MLRGLFAGPVDALSPVPAVVGALGRFDEAVAVRLEGLSPFGGFLLVSLEVQPPWMLWSR